LRPAEEVGLSAFRRHCRRIASGEAECSQPVSKLLQIMVKHGIAADELRDQKGRAAA